MAALFIFGSPQERVDALRVVREYVLLQACFPTQLRPFDTVATSEVLQLEDVSSSAVQLFTQSTSLASTLEALDRSIGSDTGMSAGHPAGSSRKSSAAADAVQQRLGHSAPQKESTARSPACSDLGPVDRKLALLHDRHTSSKVSHVSKVDVGRRNARPLSLSTLCHHVSPRIHDCTTVE